MDRTHLAEDFGEFRMISGLLDNDGNDWHSMEARGWFWICSLGVFGGGGSDFRHFWSCWHQSGKRGRCIIECQWTIFSNFT